MTIFKNEEFHKNPEVVERDLKNFGEGPNLTAEFYGERAGQTTYFNDWMNFTHVAYWDKAQSDAGTTGSQVSDYMTQMWRRLKFSRGSKFLELGSPFNGLRIETWNVDRARRTSDSIDGGIDKYAGLCWQNKLIRVNSKYAGSGNVYAHEFGHNYHNSCDIKDRPKTRIGTYLGNEYNRLRSADFTSRTPRKERFAEDFKYFFGTDDVARKDNPDDDAAHPKKPNVGKQVRWARQVNGLEEFIRGAWPVYNWLKDKDVPKFAFLDTSTPWFRWERKTSWVTSQWEAFQDGIWYRWDGKKWVVY